LPVMVPEHRHRRDRQPSARARDDRDLVELPVLGQVAGQHDHVRALLDAAERLVHAPLLAGARVDVARGGNPDPLRGHETVCPGLAPSDTGTEPGMPSEVTSGTLLDALKRAAAVLRDNDIDFALAGGFAVYARGGPETDHDVDFVLRREDAERALNLLVEAGFQTERPPEGWLYKVRDDEGA